MVYVGLAKNVHDAKSKTKEQNFLNHFFYLYYSMKFSNKEVRDLVKAWFAISLAFAIVLSGDIFSNTFMFTFLLSGLTVGVGFLLHELAHKLVAQNYGCWAEFRAFNSMLIFAVAISFLGFVFAAPGAVMINGYVNLNKNGKISLAGPLTNLVLALLFLPAMLFPISFVQQIGQYGFFINSWLALFNMIPIMGLDGSKILAWNKGIYFSVLAVAFIFVFIL